MILKFNDKEFELQFTTAAYMGLKRELNCKDLRKALLEACREENLDVLAKAIHRFAGDNLKSVNNAYPCIDQYCADNGVSKRDMFIKFIAEVNDNGFFGESKTEEELKELINSPEMDIDMDKLTAKAMSLMEERMLAQMLESGITAIGATTSKTSESQLTAAE